MRTLIPVLVASLVSSAPLAAQETDAPPPAPEAAPADVESVDAIIRALYDVISGPAGPRDWNRFLSLFAPGARLIPTGRGEDGVWRSQVWSPQQYSERVGPFFSENGFFEVEAHRHEQQYGNLVHAFSTYESRRDPTEDPFVRGINSIQLLNTGERWQILSIMWTDERSAGELPAEFLPRGH